VRRHIVLYLYPILAALLTLLVPYALLTVYVQRGPDCVAGSRFPWAGPAYVAAVAIAIGLTVIAWFVPGWRQRRLASGATAGITVLVLMALFVFGGLDYQASLSC
jgi:hypothetical protein